MTRKRFIKMMTLFIIVAMVVTVLPWNSTAQAETLTFNLENRSSNNIKLVNGYTDNYSIPTINLIDLFSISAPKPVPASVPATPVAKPTPVSAVPAVEAVPIANPSSAVAPAEGLTAEEQQMLNRVNQERAKVGLSALKVDMQLVKLARMKSKDMIDKNYFDHNSPTYGSPFDMMKTYGVNFRTGGENLACAPTVERAHTGLMNSQGHRENILRDSFTHIGIGIVDGGKCGKMFTQLFVGR